MTARAMREDRENCLESGMNDYLSKPVVPKNLAQCLEKWLPQEIATTQDQKLRGLDDAAAVSQQASETLTFDKAGMMTRLMDDEELAQMAVKGFLEDIPRQIGVLRDFVDANNPKEASRQSHLIKGAAATVGGEAMRAVAFEMENAGQLEEIRIRLPELQKQFEQLRSVLERHFPV